MWRYYAEMSAAFLLYALVLTASIDVSRSMKESFSRTLISVSPMIPFLLMLAAIMRLFRRIDEYLRLQTLENIAIAAGVTSGWTFTYGFLENAGPKLSMFNVMPMLFGTWGLLSIIRMFANR
jgi:hypothetical protein